MYRTHPVDCTAAASADSRLSCSVPDSGQVQTRRKTVDASCQLGWGYDQHRQPDGGKCVEAICNLISRVGIGFRTAHSPAHLHAGPPVIRTGAVAFALRESVSPSVTNKIPIAIAHARRSTWIRPARRFTPVPENRMIVRPSSRQP